MRLANSNLGLVIWHGFHDTTPKAGVSTALQGESSRELKEIVVWQAAAQPAYPNGVHPMSEREESGDVEQQLLIPLDLGPLPSAVLNCYFLSPVLGV